MQPLGTFTAAIRLTDYPHCPQCAAPLHPQAWSSRLQIALCNYCHGIDRDRMAELARAMYTASLQAHVTCVYGLLFWTPRRDDLRRMIARAALERLNAESVPELDART